MWCGTPELSRRGAFDNSRDCWDTTAGLRKDTAHCRDTKAGPQFDDAEATEAAAKLGHHTCRAARADAESCTCVPESVP
jgi:hypothetical protein